jgi:Mitochondrial carrier protein
VAPVPDPIGRELPSCQHVKPAGILDAARTIVRTEGVLALYKGLAPTLIGIAPFTGE